MKNIYFQLLNKFPVFRLFLYVVILPFIAVNFENCRKTKIEHYTLGELSKQVPFIGNEKLIYRNNTNDSIIFHGLGRSRRTINENSSGSGDNYTFEEDLTTFRSADANYLLGFQLTANKFHSILYVSLIEYSSGIKVKEISCLYQNLPLRKGFLAPNQWVIDSVQVINTIYYNVFADTTTYYINQSNLKSKILYEINNGAIEISDDSGEFIKLLKVIK